MPDFQKKDRIFFFLTTMLNMLVMLESMRALAAHFFGFEGMYIVPAISMLFFVALGLLFRLPRVKGRDPRQDSYILSFLFLILICGFLYFPETAHLHTIGTSAPVVFAIALGCGIPCFFFGMLIRTLSAACPQTDGRIMIFFLSTASAAGMLAFFAVLRFLPFLPVGAIIYLLFMALITIAYFRIAATIRQMWIKLLFLALVIVFNLCFSDSYLACCLLWPMHNSASGAVVLDTAQDNGKRSIRITVNGQEVVRFPHLAEVDIPPVLLAALQPNKERVHVLLAASEMSPATRAFLNLPVIEKLDLLSMEPRLIKLAGSEKYKILPVDATERLSVISANPRAFLESSREHYDLIYLERPAPFSLSENRFYTSEFFDAVAAHLTDNGVFALRLPILDNYNENRAAAIRGILAATLRHAFRHVEFIRSGDSLLALAGNRANITSSGETLDRRTEVFASEMNLPEHLFSILCPDLVQEQERALVLSHAVVAPRNQDLNPELPSYLWRESPQIRNSPLFQHLLLTYDRLRLHYGLVLICALGLYQALRYFISWKSAHKKAFILFENGLYSAAVTTLALFIIQSRLGTVYQNLGFGLGLFLTGYAASFPLLRQKRLLFLIKWASCFLPAIILWSAALPAFALMLLFPFEMLICGCSGGIIHQETLPTQDMNSTRRFALLLAAELAGAAAGTVIMTVFFTPSSALLLSVILISLIRLIRVPRRAW